jgi:hypothetical protein
MVQHFLGGGDAGVGADEQLFQLQPELLVEGRAVEEAGDAAKPGAAGALEGLLRLFFSLRGAAEEAYQGWYPLIVLAGHLSIGPGGGQRGEASVSLV